MKKLTILFALFFFALHLAQENFDLSTTRIGAYRISMKADEAEKIAGKKLLQYDDWDKNNVVTFQGEKIELKIQNTYINDKENSVPSVYSLSTKSAKFKTKRNMGVGNTKYELLEAYKDFPNFSLNQGWDDKGEKMSKTVSYFNITDVDASTELQFKLENNVVTEVSIYVNEGC